MFSELSPRRFALRDQTVTRVLRGVALFGTGALLTLACTRVKVTWDQAASAAGAGAPAVVAPALPPPSATQVADAKFISHTFTQVAEQLAPSVVSIRIEKKQKGMAHGMRRGNPFQFFGSPFGSPFGNPFGDEDENSNGGGAEEDNAPVQRGAGSGVVIDAKGMILTNNHVVGGADSIKVKFNDGKELPAKIVGTDPRSDLAVIKVDTSHYPVRAAKLGDSDKMLPGEWVVAIGNPFGLDHTVTVGVISGKGRRGITDTRGYEDFLQTDASINPGNSGGPLVNLNSEVIGINTLILGPGGNIGIGFAVPSDLAKPVVAELLATGKVRRPYVGISMQEMTAEMGRAMGAPEKGALVQAVVPGGPADKAGIRRGDVIVTVDGKKVDSTRDVQRQVFTRKIGDQVNLGIVRDGKSLALTAKAAEMPSDEALAQGGSGEEQSKAKAKLGLSLQTLTPNLSERLGIKANGGVLVAGVKGGSPAAEVGLARGDVILEVDRRPVKTAEEAVQALSSSRAEGHFLLVQKGDNAFYLTLPPG